ncbi:hypothetical protein SCP_0905050 [Sparassis crispa]|uniref:Eukaryotic translation initiation factor 4E type 2 n=1 Tax=Sparassis crispa TaxID=139825 RepID=A0A401GWM2_9APHY|nr:hypothetical protein SCP_0905050 [Sparassis crispa]GBE86626.1 hypothetical protein SCP_0905050 [Sparassis crispa]
MAGYFSNHSQSRFLAISNSTAATSTTSTTTTTTAAAAAAAANPPPAATPPATTRPRAPSSKHFSTFVAPAADDKAQGKDRAAGSGAANGAPAVHPLHHTWVFWFRQQRAPGNKITNYEAGIKKIAAFSSVESFWSLWTHLHPPSSLLPTTDYLLFHAGVRRPVWEDPLNLPGGKWIVRLRKGTADRLWEDLVLAVLGDQFVGCGDGAEGGPNGAGKERAAAAAPEGDWPEICGCTISVRQNEDIISVWNRSDADAKVKERIRETIRRVLNFPPTTVMEYKSNNDSMQDKSSFRVPAADRTPLS